MEHMTIGKLARAADVGVDTVRFYERAGILGAPRRSASGYRTYGADDVARLRFIRRAKTLGFSLEEIAGLLRLNDGGGDRASVRALARKRLGEVERQLAELTAIKSTLAALVHRCASGEGARRCPIIEAVLDAAPVEPKRTRRSLR